MFDGLPIALLPIYIAVFIDVLGLTILIPMLPVLAGRLHVSDVVIGVALSVTAVFATISSPVWGGLSDRIGRKNVIQASQLFSLGGYILLALAGNVYMLFAARAIEGLGGGNLGVVQSFIADVTDDDHREKAFSFSAGVFGLGFVCGPVLAGLLLRAGGSAPFWAAAALQLLNFALTAKFLTKHTREGEGEENEDAGSSAKGLVGELRKGPMLNLMGRQFLYIFSFTYFFTVFSLYLQKELHMDPTQSSLLLGLAGLVGAAPQFGLIEKLDKKFGDFRLAQVSFAVGFVAYAAMFFVHGNVGIFIAILVIWALSGSTLRPTLNKLISQRADEKRRGAVLGFADSLNNASMIVAPAAAGAILGVGPAYIGILPAVAIAGAFVLGMLSTDDRNSGMAAQPG